MPFRLISVAPHPQSPRLLRDPQESTPSLPSTGSATLLLAGGVPADEWATTMSIVIGSNGTGKSRMLGDIVRAFLWVERRRSNSKLFPLQHLSYELDGMLYKFEKVDQRIFCFVNGVEADIDEVRVPRTMALTLTPFDKFPLPIYKRGTFNEIEEDSHYTYFGLRDRTNRASITALLYRSLERLIDASNSSVERRRQVVGVFRFLGYKARVQIVYQLDISIRYLHDEFFGPDVAGRKELRSTYRMKRALEEGSITESEVLKSLETIRREFQKNQEFFFILDFEGLAYSADLLSSIKMLRRVGLIRLRAVEIERLDGVILDLKEASSGELSIVTSFLSLATTMDDSTLILIDEPETSLHPAWQNRYIDLLLKTFSHYRGCHYLIATHSPLILSEIQKANSMIVYLDSAGGSGTENIAGQSPDYLLVNAFGSPGRNNYYLKHEIVNVLRLVADQKADTDEFFSAMKRLRPLLKKLDPSDPVYMVISDLEKLRKEIMELKG
jgi:predicted ATPase